MNAKPAADYKAANIASEAGYSLRNGQTTSRKEAKSQARRKRDAARGFRRADKRDLRRQLQD